MALKFGKNPASAVHYHNAPKLINFYNHAAIIIPDEFGLGTAPDASNIYLNDQLGICVGAGAAHETRTFVRLGTGQEVEFPDASLLKFYSDVGGYVPGDPSTDQGMDMGAAAKYRQTTGIIDSTGKAHKIVAALALRPSDWDQMIAATYEFQCVGFGFQVQEGNDTDFGRIDWDYRPGRKNVGGHYAAQKARNSKGRGVCDTWGGRQGFTRSFYEHQNDESYVYVSEDMVKNGKFPRGFDVTAFNDYLAAVAA